MRSFVIRAKLLTLNDAIDDDFVSNSRVFIVATLCVDVDEEIKVNLMLL